MRLNAPRIQDMNHLCAEGDERIGDHAPVTAPPENFRAHDRGPKTPRRHHELEETPCKFFTGHVVGVTLEAWLAPSGVRSARDRPASASEGRDPEVGHSRSVQRILECRLSVLRLASRAGKATDIGQELDPVRREQLEKVG